MCATSRLVHVASSHSPSGHHGAAHAVSNWDKLVVTGPHHALFSALEISSFT